MNAPDAVARTIRTRRGWRLVQHGTVLSEILFRPGPTHSVFDFLAATARLQSTPRRIAILGFAGGSVLAALRALRVDAEVHGVDLDPRGHQLLAQATPEWLGNLQWHHDDAVRWLRRSRQRFDLIIEDLSVPIADEVEKPQSSWDILPPLIARKLTANGLAVFNLLRPANHTWTHGFAVVTAPFAHAARLDLRDYHNRIVIASNRPIAAGTLSRTLRRALAELGSSQAERFRAARARVANPP